ncbi:hypothetical protein [Pseudofrankia sp. BMG5.36]|uniref:hypothetical protein n=1 Tax=Pseudofrankia sp. BMG5.36 TaxID=1834512 RepID=UPI000A54672F|nr:hypothetical protein [Pseudofrankia sp. BMG5.36]
MAGAAVPPGKAGAASGGEGAGRRARAASAGFDRLRPRTGRSPASGEASSGSRPGVIGRDMHGKRALYSGERPPDPHGSGVTVNCSRCMQAATVGARRALTLLTPSLHLPIIRPRYPSLLRCPACRRVSWVRLTLSVTRD